MKKLRRAVTLWYVKRGYTFEYDFSNVSIYGDDYIAVPGNLPTSVWHCPWWVRPLLIFFSPSVYTIETFSKLVVQGFNQGFTEELQVSRQKLIDTAKMLTPMEY